MSEFKASNGWWIEGGQLVDELEGTQSMSERQVDFARRFFREERDYELGRWRSKEHPDYVVYPSADGTVVAVIAETDGVRTFHHRDDMVLGVVSVAVAQEFFAAHPVGEPWEDAKPGELWELTVNGDEGVACAMCPSVGTRFVMVRNGQHVDLDSDEITAGRRIYPEEDA